MIKKLFFFIGFLPIVSYSCSEEKNPQRIITKDPVTSNSTILSMPTKKATILSHDRIYQDILPKYKEFAKVDVFIPGNWVVDGWFIKDYRTQKDESGFRIPFNSNFFHNTEDIKQSKHIKITTKDKLGNFFRTVLPSPTIPFG